MRMRYLRPLDTQLEPLHHVVAEIKGLWPSQPILDVADLPRRDTEKGLADVTSIVGSGGERFKRGMIREPFIILAFDKPSE